MNSNVFVHVLTISAITTFDLKNMRIMGHALRIIGKYHGEISRIGEVAIIGKKSPNHI